MKVRALKKTPARKTSRAVIRRIRTENDNDRKNGGLTFAAFVDGEVVGDVLVTPSVGAEERLIARGNIAKILKWGMGGLKDYYVLQSGVDSKHQRKGLATRIYVAAARYIHRKTGGTLYSSNVRSYDAKQFWQSLKQRGLAERVTSNTDRIKV